jgi:hypothetical protein
MSERTAAMGKTEQTPPAAAAVSSPIEVKVASIGATYTHSEQSARGSNKLFKSVADSAQ